MKLYLGFGANKNVAGESRTWAIDQAYDKLQAKGLKLIAKSPFYQSRSLVVGQADYINCVALFDTVRSASTILAMCKQVERHLGRRGCHIAWAPRIIDIDLLALGNQIIGPYDAAVFAGPVSKRPLIVPHPQMHLRRFVLEPLFDVDPNWRHPLFYLSAKALIAKYCANQALQRL